jgi:hypothetical protein
MSGTQTNHRASDLHLDELQQRINATDDLVAEHETRIDALERSDRLLTEQMIGMRLDLGRNTEATEDIRDVMQAARAGFRVLGWLGTALKVIATIGAALVTIIGIWQALRNGTGLPTKP